MRKSKDLSMLSVLYGAAFIAAFNENLVNTGLTGIMADFSISAATAQWLVTGYMIVTTIVVTLVAFLLRRFTLRGLFTFASVLLVVGALICMVAPTFPLLLCARLVQAIGTGIFVPMMMNTVLATAPREKMGTYLSIGGCAITFGPAFAPAVSGLMVTMWGWRSAFILPAVITAALLVCGLLLVHNLGDKEQVTLDVLSLVFSVAGLTAFVIGVSEITVNLLLAVGLIAGGIALLAGFVMRQGRIPQPILDLTPLHNRRFAATCLLVIVAMMTTFSMSVLLPLYYEAAAGTTAFAAGAFVLIPILVNAATALIGGRVMDRRGEWPLLPLGFLAIAIGQILTAVVSRQAGAFPVVLSSIIVYAGVGLIFSPSQTAGLKQLDSSMNEHGVAIINTFVQMAACIGPSLFVGILSSTSSTAISVGTAAQIAEASGFSAAVFVAAVIGAIGFITALLYTRHMHVRSHEDIPCTDAS